MVVNIDHPRCGTMKLVNTPVKFSFSNPSVRSAPPTLGQHTNEILKEIGISNEDVKSLRAEGVIA
jgi:succinate---hydroxymethylglutarate CoA-transferase